MTYTVTLNSGETQRVAADGHHVLASGALELFFDRSSYNGGYHETCCVFAPGSWRCVERTDAAASAALITSTP